MFAPAELPPVRLPGLDSSWSRLVSARDAHGGRRTWHLLDSGERRGQTATLLCVHGNPTWSYLWRALLATADDVRVIAVDQLDMGFSERTGVQRRLADRITDLSNLTEELGLTGPVVTVGHDWGGVVSLGWALQHHDQLAGVVLTNTAIHQPPSASAPALIRLARARRVLTPATATTTMFLDTTLSLAHPRLHRAVRAAYRAPYHGADRRMGIEGFVQDIPLEPSHPSFETLHGIATGLDKLAEVPTLLLWGPRDPVFSDRYLRDLRRRLPHADVHRFEGAGHLLAEDADVAGTVFDWLRAKPEPTATADPTPIRPLWTALDQRAGDRGAAVVEMSAHGRRTISWDLLQRKVTELAAGLVHCGVKPGHRVALLVLPGADLTAAVYACARIGAVIVVADAGLGVRGLHRALRGAAPDHVIGIPRALLAAIALQWPGQRISTRRLGSHLTLADVAERGLGKELPDPPDPDADAAVLFTSGSTGPAKGVRYTHRQLAELCDVLARTYHVGSDTRLVAAFAPFALFSPALGATSVVPDMDVTAPRTLSASALADACAAIDATTVFASPAALVNVVATAEELDEGQRIALSRVEVLLSAGAPIPVALLRQVVAVMPSALPHTPYGMTEALTVTDITLAGIEKAGTGNGVCVGYPAEGVDVAISPLDGGALTSAPDTTGEIAVRARHIRAGYDQLWSTNRVASREPGWHHTGDVGHLDDTGRLWVEGRLAHIIRTAAGVVTPVGVEQRVETLSAVRRAAAVGVGPDGVQQVVIVVEPTDRIPAGLAPLSLVDSVRAVAGTQVAAVLVVAEQPTDIRHNSKIDRTRLARWADRVLSGGRVGKP